MPGLGELHKKYGKDLQVIGWHVGKGEAKDVEAAVKKHKVKFAVVMSPGWDELLAWGLPKIPRAVVIDRSGKIVAHDLLPHDAEKKAEDLLKHKG